MPSASISAQVGRPVQHSASVHELPSQVMPAGAGEMALAWPEQSWGSSAVPSALLSAHVRRAAPQHESLASPSQQSGVQASRSRVPPSAGETPRRHVTCPPLWPASQAWGQTLPAAQPRLTTSQRSPSLAPGDMV